MNQVTGGIGEPKGNGDRDYRDGFMRRAASTPSKDRSEPHLHSNRKWVEHTRTARALNVIFTLYVSEQISDRAGA